MAEASPGDADRFSLEVSASASAPATARLFIGAVLRALGNEDRIEDLKLVVSEAITAITGAAPGTTATVRLDAAAGMLEVEPLDASILPPGSIGMDVISALFAAAHIDDQAHRLVIPFGASVATP